MLMKYACKIVRRQNRKSISRKERFFMKWTLIFRSVILNLLAHIKWTIYDNPLTYSSFENKILQPDFKTMFLYLLVKYLTYGHFWKTMYLNLKIQKWTLIFQSVILNLLAHFTWTIYDNPLTYSSFENKILKPYLNLKI